MASKKKLKKQIAMLEQRIKTNHRILVMDLARTKRQSDYWRTKYFDLLYTTEGYATDGTKQSEANQ